MYTFSTMALLGNIGNMGWYLNWIGRHFKTVWWINSIHFLWITRFHLDQNSLQTSGKFIQTLHCTKCFRMFGVVCRSNTFKVHFRSKMRKRTNASFSGFQVEWLTSNFDTYNKLMYKYKKWTQTVESYNLYRVKYNKRCLKSPPPLILLFF